MKFSWIIHGFVLCFFEASAQETINVDWAIPEGSSLPDRSAGVGDTVVFTWSRSSYHNVYIHQRGTCSLFPRTFVGASNPTSYTFDEDDAKKGEVVFACDVGSHCESGQIVKFVVSSLLSSPTFEMLSASPTTVRTDVPTILTTESPTDFPTMSPTDFPTMSPILSPTKSPIDSPQMPLTTSPVASPIMQRTQSPTSLPTSPTDSVTTKAPTRSPTTAPTRSPTKAPTRSPTKAPTRSPTKAPTRSPTRAPTLSPTKFPTEPPASSLTSSMTSRIITIDWTIPSGLKLPDMNANAGDTVVFEWSFTHNVYIHPTGTCSNDRSVLVGNDSPATYTFTEEDVTNGEVTFACDIGNHCENGQILTFDTVASSQMFNIDWRIPFGSNFPEMNANVGDTVVFEFSSSHNVYIHPTGNCLESNSILVKETSPATYTFTEEDAINGEIVFACDTGPHCEVGQILKFTFGSLSTLSMITELPTSSPSEFPIVSMISPIITVDWNIPSGSSLPDMDVMVGDTVGFEWSFTHNVYKHPAGDCGLPGRLFVGNVSPATYTFTEEDATNGEVVFACDVGNHCENGQIMKFNVRSLLPRNMNVDWNIPSGSSLPDMNAKVGDTVMFEWSFTHNVYKHPAGDCELPGRLFVGNKSPTTYTFTEEDATNGEVVFACDVGNHCENGQIMTFSVDSTSSLATPASLSPMVWMGPTTINLTWYNPNSAPLIGGNLRFAYVGDDVVFDWVFFHNVYIHPTGDCSMADRVLVGDVSPASYTFTEEDAESGEVVFACDIGLHCLEGMLLTFIVLPVPM